MPNLGVLLSAVILALILIPPAAASANAPPESHVVEASNGRFHAVAPDGRTLRGADLKGTTFLIEVRRGQSVFVRIDDVEVAPENGVALYVLSHRSKDADDWVPVCGPDQYGKRRGLPLPMRVLPGSATSDDRSFTLACTSGAYGKCIMRGYLPWAQSTTGTVLTPYFQACARMMMADYCGDGTSFTTEGRRIDSWDKIGIRAPTGTGLIEAAWNAAGPVCVTRARADTIHPLESVLAQCPSLRSKMIPDCEEFASDDANGALIWNR